MIRYKDLGLCKVSCNVFHPAFIRMWSDPIYMYFSASYLNKEQYIKRDQSGSCKHFSCKEITGSDHIFMHSNEVTLGELWFSTWCRHNTIPFKYIADSLITNMIAQIRKCTGNTIIAPPWVSFTDLKY